MRIDMPEVVVDGEFATLQARVRFGQRAGAFPERLWFRYPRRFESLLYRGVEPFIVALSSLASMLREPIEVEGTVSERLHAGLDEYWMVFHRWHPQRFFPVALTCGGYAAEPVPAPACGTAFSGGVDSFFTVFRHMQGRETRPTHRVQYALFAHGFDIPLSDERTYAVAAGALEGPLAACGVQLVRVATNIRQFVDRADWEMSHGSALCGTALTLSPAVRRFFVPSSKSYTTLEPWGSDPLVDGLLSTDQFQVIHDGAAYTRFDKLYAMRDWELIRPLLRTCWKRPNGLRNCGSCTNCLRTMTVLAALGVLDKFQTFPQIALPGNLGSAAWDTPHERLFGEQAIDYARANGRAGVARVTRLAMHRSRVKSLGKTSVGARALTTLAWGWGLVARIWKRCRIRVVRLDGYLHLLSDGMSPQRAADATAFPEYSRVITRSVDDRAAGIGGDDIAQLRAGCFRTALLRNEAVLAQQWVRIGRQYPPVLDTALRVGPHTAYLFGLFVDSGSRRRGLGRQAIEFAEREARAAGSTAGFVWIERANRASVLLLTSVGYRPVAAAIRITLGSLVWFWCGRLDADARSYVAKPQRRAGF